MNANNAILVPAPLVDRLVARAWDDDCDDRSRELLEEAAELLRHQAAEVNNHMVRVTVPPRTMPTEVEVAADIDAPRTLRVVVRHDGLLRMKCIGCGMPLIVKAGAAVELFDPVDPHDQAIGPLCASCREDRPSPPVPVQIVTLRLDD